VRTLPFSLLLALAVGVVGCAQAPAAPAAQEDTSPALAEGKLLPAVIVRDYFMLPLALDGRDGSDGQEERILWMLYDTGASITVVDPEKLAEVSDWEVGQSSRVNIQKATIGPATVSNLSATIRDLDHIEQALGFEIDGILGYSTFSGTLLTLDYPRHEMRVRPGELPKADGERIFRITRKERRRPFIEFEFGGREEEVLIDSGSGSGFVLRDRRGRDFVGELAKLGITTGINGPRAEATGRLDGDATLFGRRFQSPAVRLTDGTELLGTQVLRHFSLTFDIENRRVLVEGAGDAFASEAAATIAPYPLRASGVLRTAEEEAFRVRAVLDDSPATAAGVQVGDRIVATNHVPYAERGGEPPQPWVDGERRWYRLQLERDGELLEVEVDLKTYLPVPSGVEPATPRWTLPRDLVAHTFDPPAPTPEQIADRAELASPTGERRAVVFDHEGHTVIRVLDARGRILGNPVTRGRNVGLRWSEDGTWLAFWREVEQNGELVWSRWAVPANGAQPPEPIPVR
jgi:hypothetical protein